MKREQELDVPEDTGHKHTLEEGEEQEQPAITTEPPKKARRKDIEGNLRSRENILVLSHKDFSNIIQVYAAAEKVYMVQKKTTQDGKVCCSILEAVSYTHLTLPTICSV